MSDQQTPRRYRRLYSFMTKTRFLHVEDALRMGKVRLYAGAYKRGQGSEAMCVHFMDWPDVLVLAHNILHTPLPWEYREYKGSPHGPDGPTSRVLKVRADEGKDGQGRLWVRLENGPGEVAGEGAIKPKGDPTSVVDVPFTVNQAHRLALALQSLVQAWQVMAYLNAPEVESDQVDMQKVGEILESAEETERDPWDEEEEAAPPAAPPPSPPPPPPPTAPLPSVWVRVRDTFDMPFEPEVVKALAISLGYTEDTILPALQREEVGHIIYAELSHYERIVNAVTGATTIENLRAALTVIQGAGYQPVEIRRAMSALDKREAVKTLLRDGWARRGKSPAASRPGQQRGR